MIRGRGRGRPKGTKNQAGHSAGRPHLINGRKGKASSASHPGVSSSNGTSTTVDSSSASQSATRTDGPLFPNFSNVRKDSTAAVPEADVALENRNFSSTSQANQMQTDVAAQQAAGQNPQIVLPTRSWGDMADEVSPNPEEAIGGAAVPRPGSKVDDVAVAPIARAINSTDILRDMLDEDTEKSANVAETTVLKDTTDCVK
ncbi:hypothetical protein DFS34DRAFT_683660, partial [Phlyctochytrium arcticum]